MTLPSSGPISFSQLQGEFGGSNPISLSEYYRGAYTTNNNTGVPTSGTISLSNFYGTLRTSYLSEIINALQSNRNNFVSALDYARGFETNGNINWGQGGDATERYATTVDATLYPSLVSNIITTYVTIIVRTLVASPGATSVIVNGTDYGVSTVAFNDVLVSGSVASSIWVAHAPVNYASLSSIRAIINKASNNSLNTEEVYILPGYWNVVSKTTGAGTFSIGGVNTYDVLYGARARNVDGLVGFYGTFGGVSTNHLMGRELNWYEEASHTYDIATSSGTGNYNAGSYSGQIGCAGSSHGRCTNPVYGTINDNGQVLVMRYAYS